MSASACGGVGTAAGGRVLGTLPQRLFRRILAVLLLVLAEQLGSSNGIGWFVLYSQQGYDVPGMWAGILMLALLGIGANALLSLAERRVLRWHFNLRGIDV